MCRFTDILASTKLFRVSSVNDHISIKIDNLFLFKI